MLATAPRSSRTGPITAPRPVFTRPRVTVVAGAPCAGKSTYIAERAQPDDAIVDLDRLALAIAPDGMADHAYSEAIRQLAHGAREGIMDRLASFHGHAWVIDTRPTATSRARYRDWRAEMVTLDPGREVCIARATALRPEMIPVIEAWYGDAGR